MAFSVAKNGNHIIEEQCSSITKFGGNGSEDEWKAALTLGIHYYYYLIYYIVFWTDITDTDRR